MLYFLKKLDKNKLEIAYFLVIKLEIYNKLRTLIGYY